MVNVCAFNHRFIKCSGLFFKSMLFIKHSYPELYLLIYLGIGNFCFLQLKSKDVLDKYDEEIFGQKRESFVLGEFSLMRLILCSVVNQALVVLGKTCFLIAFVKFHFLFSIYNYFLENTSNIFSLGNVFSNRFLVST